MKKFKIKFQLGMNICVSEIKAEDVVQARYLFAMSNNGAADIIDIEEVIESE